MTVEELNIIIRASGQTSYNTAMRSVAQSTLSFESAAGKLASTLARIVSVGSMLKFSSQCIKAASDLQEVANVVSVTFGQSANIVNDWARSQAVNFGLSEKSAKEYIGTYGTMAKQFNFATEQAVQMGIELTKLTGDVASFYNIDDKLASIRLKSIFTGETETLKALGVVMTEANLNAYAMEKGLGKTVKQLSEQEKVALRYSFVMDKLSHTQGDFANTSANWANATRIFKLRLENLKIEIGNQLLPVAGYALNTISNGIAAISRPLVIGATYIRLYTEAWKRASTETKNFLKIGIGIFTIGMLIPKIISIGTKAIAAFKAGMTALTINAITLGTALKWMFGIAGIALSLVAFKRLSGSIKDIKAEEATKELEALSDTSAIASDAVDGLADSMDGLGDATKELETFLAPFDEVNKIGEGNSLMSNLITSSDLENILEASSGLNDMNSIIDEINESSISPNFDTDAALPEWLTTEWWGGLFGYIKQNLQSGHWKEDAKIMLDGIYSTLKGWFPNWFGFWESAGAIVFDLLHGVDYTEDVEQLTAFLEAWLPNWSKFWEGVGAIVFDLLHDVDYTEDLEQLMASFEAWAPKWSKFWENIGAECYDILGNIKQSIIDLVEWTDLVLGDKKFGESDVKLSAEGQAAYEKALKNHPERFSTYAAGGYPNKGSLFIAGESGAELIGNFGTSQTRVINQSQITNNNSQPINFSPIIQIDGRKITSTVVENINSMTRSSGMSPLITLGG